MEGDTKDGWLVTLDNEALDAVVMKLGGNLIGRNAAAWTECQDLSIRQELSPPASFLALVFENPSLLFLLCL